MKEDASCGSLAWGFTICHQRCVFQSQKPYGLGVADKAASLMGCESPTANCPIRAVSISDVWRGNELYDARK